MSRKPTRSEFFSGLRDLTWSNRRDDNDRLLGRLLRELGSTSAPSPGPLEEHLDVIAAVCACQDLDDLAAGIAQWNHPPLGASSDSQKWLEQAAKALAAGCPSTARLGFTLQKRARNQSLAEVFRMEYLVSLHCATHTDFAEGIRALLIDKDRTPHWQPGSLAEASAAWIEWFFESPWSPSEHPLADLH